MAANEIQLHNLNLSTSFNDEDLLIIAKYNASTNSYVSVDKVKVSTLKKLIKDTAGTSGSGSGGSLDFNDYNQVLNAADDDLVLIAKHDDLTDTYSEYRTVKVSALKGASNLTEDHVILQDDNGTQYRLYLSPNGHDVKIEKESAFAERELLASQNANYHGLLINMIYGAGNNITKMPVSHNFIELYNNTNTDLNITGLHIHYRDTTTYTNWVTKELKGIVPAYSSFLIVGGRCANPWDTQCRHQIDKYDMQWLDSNGNGMKFSDNGFSVCLSVTDSIPDTPDLYIKDTVTGSYTTNKTENII